MPTIRILSLPGGARGPLLLQDYQLIDVGVLEFNIRHLVGLTYAADLLFLREKLEAGLPAELAADFDTEQLYNDRLKKYKDLL